MSEVKRWTHHVTWDGEIKIQATMMALRNNGEYVLASDYDALAAKFNDPEYPPKHSRRLIEQLRTDLAEALAELAALKGGRDDAELTDRMKAAGMLSVAELLAGQPLDCFQRHAGVHDLATFAQWLEMRRTECLKMHARFQLEGREDDDELYEWVIAHAAVFGEVHINFKAAMEAPPAQASAWVPEGAGYFEQFCSANGYLPTTIMRRTWDASSRIAAQVPRGWQLVPIEPTQSMVEIGAQCVYEPTGKGDVQDVWSNMLAAAPTPGASDGKGGES